MTNIYCNSSNIGTKLKEINKTLTIGEELKLTIDLNKSQKLYYGYFVYHGFKVNDMLEENKKVIINIIKNKNIQPTFDRRYSWLIKLPRTGKNGKRIYVYKLRTMQPYSEYIQDFVIQKNGLNDDGTIRNDFRITRVGKFLRKYWIDELPMLINFIKGDLKLIGVRPLSDTMLNTYPKEFIPIRNRHKPGLIPPYYIDSPDSFEGLIESEKKYIKAYEKNGFYTDIKYFFMFLNRVFLKGVRSS
jgi:lipopolysaccharide/colanic/teichoic acid biosynthesis glycosyltransferase